MTTLAALCQGERLLHWGICIIVSCNVTSGFRRLMVVPSTVFTAKWFKIACWGFWIHSSCPACRPGRLLNYQPISWPKTLNRLSKKPYSTLALFCQWPFLACKKKMKLDLLYIWPQFTGQNISGYVWTNNIIKSFQNFGAGGVINKIQQNNKKIVYWCCQILALLLFTGKSGNLATWN